VPQALGLARDPRCVGVAVRRVVARQGTRFRTFRKRSVAGPGVHAFEPQTGLRWMDGWGRGAAGALFAGFPGSCEVVVHLGGTARYIDDGGVMAVA
jgi:hypothetical protein